MQTVTCQQCGQLAKLQRQTVEYVVKLQDGVEMLVLSKMRLALDCPQCGPHTQEEPVAAD